GIHALDAIDLAGARTADVSADARRHRARHRGASPLNHPGWQTAAEAALGLSGLGDWTPMGASAWGQSFSLAAGGVRHYVKIATARHASMLDGEGDGLRALAATRMIRVPQIAAQVRHGDVAVLALEWLDTTAASKGAAMGRALAALHRAEAPRGSDGERFGWRSDNWIGGTPQRNRWTDDWCAFFREQRLLPQLALAAQNGFGGKLQRDGERVIETLPAFLPARAPSLLHGDLWSGNAAMLASGEPAIFDPAVYVGDREADVAMTELFGGFDADFYAAYRDASP